MRENRSSGFLTLSDTNRPVQSQKQARILKFWAKVEEELYYPWCENKGADQLCSYCTADLCLYFRIGIVAHMVSFVPHHDKISFLCS